MSWKEIGKAVNDTFARKCRKRALNRIVEDEAYEVIYGCAVNDSLGQSTKHLIIPKGVHEIQEERYADVSYESLVLPNSVKVIGAGAFHDSDLRVAILPPSIEYIGNDAFNGCTRLMYVTLPKHLKTIGAAAFKGIIMTGIEIPETVETIGIGAFTNTSLVTVMFRGTPTNIGTAAFQTMTLKDIYVPWAEGAVPGAPWGASNATIHYESEACT